MSHERAAERERGEIMKRQDSRARRIGFLATGVLKNTFGVPCQSLFSVKCLFSIRIFVTLPLVCLHLISRVYEILLNLIYRGIVILSAYLFQQILDFDIKIK